MSNLSNCLFTGCSFTQGVGLLSEYADPGLWVNILHSTHPKLKSLNLINSGVSGYNNKQIFCKTVEDLITHRPTTAFVCWTEPSRITVNPGLETYPTSLFLGGCTLVEHGVNLVDVTYSKDYIENIKNRFFDLTNLHYEFLELLNYCRILTKLANQLNVTLYFVNGICFWDDNYFTYNADISRLPEDLTELTKKLIQTDLRSDIEIFIIYDRMHSEYKTANGLTNWLNLYNGFRTKFYLDLGNDNLHPGYISNKKFAEFLLTQL